MPAAVAIYAEERVVMLRNFCKLKINRLYVVQRRVCLFINNYQNTEGHLGTAPNKPGSPDFDGRSDSSPLSICRQTPSGPLQLA